VTGIGAISPLEEKLTKIASSGETPRLLLHCCCAPCASYVLEYLSPFFKITALFFNPNVKPREEYDKRSMELYRLVSHAGYPNHVDAAVCEYDANAFDAVAAPYSDEPEGGRRCRACFELRLGKAAQQARVNEYEYFTTTLSVSPHKDAELLNEIGNQFAKQFGVEYLLSDFKKRGGYSRSVELSKQYGLYRQNYCGCRHAERVINDQ